MADNLSGNKPFAIRVNDVIVFLNHDLICTENGGYSLVPVADVNIVMRYVNLYRAADGTFVFGKKSYRARDHMLGLRDTGHALATVKVTYNNATGDTSIERL